METRGIAKGGHEDTLVQGVTGSQAGIEGGKRAQVEQCRVVTKGSWLTSFFFFCFCSCGARGSRLNNFPQDTL